MVAIVVPEVAEAVMPVGGNGTRSIGRIGFGVHHVALPYPSALYAVIRNKYSDSLPSNLLKVTPVIGSLYPTICVREATSP